MKRILSICLLTLFLSACSHIQTMQLSQDEKDYIEKVKAFPLELTIPKTDEADAWGRAQSFVGRFSSMKLQTATDFIIQTYNPSSSDESFGYYVTKTPLRDSVQMNIRCNVGNQMWAPDAELNGHILAYYVKTGELPYPRLINK